MNSVMFFLCKVENLCFLVQLRIPKCCALTALEQKLSFQISASEKLLTESKE